MKPQKTRYFMIFFSALAMTATSAVAAETICATAFSTLGQDLVLHPSAGLPAVFPERALDFKLPNELPGLADSKIIEQMIDDLVAKTPIMFPISNAHMRLYEGADNLEGVRTPSSVTDDLDKYFADAKLALFSGETRSAKDIFELSTMDQVPWESRLDLARKILNRVLNEGAEKSAYWQNRETRWGDYHTRVFPKVDKDFIRSYTLGSEADAARALQWLNRARVEPELREQLASIMAAGFQDWSSQEQVVEPFLPMHRSYDANGAHAKAFERAIANILQRRTSLALLVKKQLQAMGALLNRNIPAQEYWPKWKRGAVLFNQQLQEMGANAPLLRPLLSQDLTAEQFGELRTKLGEANSIHSYRLLNVQQMLTHISSSELPNGRKFAEVFPVEPPPTRGFFGGIKRAPVTRPLYGTPQDFAEIQKASAHQRDQFVQIKKELDYLEQDLQASQFGYEKLRFASRAGGEADARVESLHQHQALAAQQVLAVDLMRDQIDTAVSHLKRVDLLIAMHGGAVPDAVSLDLIRQELQAYRQIFVAPLTLKPGH